MALFLLLQALLLPALAAGGKKHKNDYYYRYYTIGELEGKLLYAHMSKTGGTQIHKALRQSVALNSTVWHMEANGLNDAHRSAFVMGSIRNPCNYYVSLWAFQSTSVGLNVGLMSNMRKREPEQYERLVGKNQAEGFSTPDDISRFQEWLKYISKPTLGYYSARFYRKYVERIPVGAKPIDMKNNAYLVRDLKPKELAKQIKELAAANVQNLTSCWIKTENLEDDLVDCLEKFKPVAVGGKEAVNIEQAKAVLEAGGQGGGKVNESPHGPCESYYDSATQSLVMTMDKLIFEKFGYDRCCEPKSARKKPEL